MFHSQNGAAAAQPVTSPQGANSKVRDRRDARPTAWFRLKGCLKIQLCPSSSSSSSFSDCSGDFEDEEETVLAYFSDRLQVFFSSAFARVVIKFTDALFKLLENGNVSDPDIQADQTLLACLDSAISSCVRIAGPAGAGSDRAACQ